MSWTSDDAMLELVEHCVSNRCRSYYAVDLVIRWLQKELENPQVTKMRKQTIREQLSKLKPGYDL
ncbi:MAG: hypothetical protein ACLKAN_13545 [Alkaliphilus sp.]